MSTHKYLDETGLAQLWGKIKNLMPADVLMPEDDINIINLLAEYDFVAPIEDADGYVITDVDDNLIVI